MRVKAARVARMGTAMFMSEVRGKERVGGVVEAELELSGWGSGGGVGAMDGRGVGRLLNSGMCLERRIK